MHTKQHHPNSSVQQLSHKNRNNLPATAYHEQNLAEMIQKVNHTTRILSRGDMVLLQRTVGNQAIGKLIQQRQNYNHDQEISQGSRLIRNLSGQVIQRDCGNDTNTTILTDRNLLAFTEAFNQEFSTILHLFESPSDGMAANPVPQSTSLAGDTGRSDTTTTNGQNSHAEATHARGNRLAGSQGGNAVDACKLHELFTETQRTKLMKYFQDHQIPDRLFNGDEVGQSTAQQRLLLAAHILANGTYQPGSFEQRVHARMCFHWVHIVHHYAGATPAGSLSSGVMGNFDHAGNIVLGTGSTEQVFFGSKVRVSELPSEESEGVGPIPAGTGHASSLAKGVQGIHRRNSLPFERFSELQPGDWLWYYNANSSAGGSHSVIFSRWASGEQRAGGFRYRAAVCFSQGRPDAGGREHNVNLGESFFSIDKFSIHPIAYVTRVNQGARPATDVDALLPEGSPTRKGRLQGSNQSYLRQVERRLRHPVDIARLLAHLRTENQSCITQISNRLTEGQQYLLQEANTTDNLEKLIRLQQRLRMLVTNSALLERNMRSTYDEHLDQRHTAVMEQVEAEQQRIERDLQALDVELEPIEEQIETLLDRREALDPSSRIRDLRQEIGRVWWQYQGLPRQHPDRAGLREHREKMLAQITSLRVEQHTHRQELNTIRQQLVALRRQSKQLSGRRLRLERQRAGQHGALPYGLVHPGNLGSQDKTRLSGKLEDLYNFTQMRQFLVAERQEDYSDRNAIQ